ncbi:MAG: pilus motility taxis protein HmpF [Pseudanabaenaceae cyanobacterium]
MQYLAEVQKVQGFVGTKTALKLLARNNNDVWQAVPNEQVINTEPNTIKDFKDGQLVIADITGSSQVNTVQDATRKIIASLQSLSRVQDKFRVAEEEIEQWKENLQLQAQELHRREQELEQREIELENLEIIRHEVEKAQLELEENQRRFEALRQELEERGKALANEQLAELLDLCDRLSSSIPDPQLARSALAIIYDRQNILNQFWQELDSQRGQVHHQETQLTEYRNHLQARRQQWQQSQAVFAEMKTELKVQERLLQVQEQHRHLVQSQLLTKEDLYQQIATIVESLGGAVASDLLSPEEIERLENMPLEELEAEIQRLEASFHQDASFLTAQEEELADIEGEIAELRSRIEKEKDFAKKLELEAELASLQEEYDFQEESISGQRQTFQRRQEMLNQQKAILERRQNPARSGEVLETMMQCLRQLEEQKVWLSQELQKLDGQIASARNYLQQQQEQLRQREQQHQQEQQQLLAEEQELISRYHSLGELVSRVAVQEAILRPVQDIIDQIRPLLEQMTHALGDSDPQHLVGSLRQTLQSVSG